MIYRVVYRVVYRVEYRVVYRVYTTIMPTTNKMCRVCHNKTEAVFKDDLQFTCPVCFDVSKATPEDTLRSKRVKGEAPVNNKLLKNIYDDPSNPKIENYCSKCKGRQLMRTTQIQDKKIIAQCRKCKTLTHEFIAPTIQ